MSNGYKQFFKTASSVKRGDTHPAPAKSAAQTVTKKFTMKPQSRPQPITEEKLRRALGKTSVRKKAPVPWKAVAGLSATLALLGFYLAAPEYVENLYKKVEIGAFGQATAEEKKAEKSAEKTAEKSKAKGGAEEKAAEHGKAESKGKNPDETHTSAEDLSHFEKLKQRKEELDLREKELAQLEEELQRQKVELDKRIAQLEEMRGQIGQILKDRVEVDQEKVNKLVDLYSNMKPKQAAEVIGSINEDLAVEILAKMKKKNAAEVMNLLPPEKAKVLSEKYTGYRRSIASEPKG